MQIERTEGPGMFHIQKVMVRSKYTDEILDRIVRKDVDRLGGVRRDEPVLTYHHRQANVRVLGYSERGYQVVIHVLGGLYSWIEPEALEPMESE